MSAILESLSALDASRAATQARLARTVATWNLDIVCLLRSAQALGRSEQALREVPPALAQSRRRRAASSRAEWPASLIAELPESPAPVTSG
ncbi:hypothetical protein [Methylobacterium sp. WSM2598]|uniref:hypothetical protein n=1 Tax=Methylobacterium sp. WSM2598 TaxID=398261 RepID=UPI00037100FA|nr:hypothetical protein [Methylobacterium sp. WSM2598]